MSDMQAVRNKLQIVAAPGNGRFEQAKWLVDNHMATFEEFNEDFEEAWDPDMVYANGNWYRVIERQELDAYGFTVASQDQSSGVIEVVGLWYNGGAGESEIMEDAIKDLHK